MTRRDTLKLAGLSVPMAAAAAAAGTGTATAMGDSPAAERPYLILSCDGGGIRGLLTAKVIERLEADVPFLHRVDLFAGTSTGGIIALGLAHGLRPSQLVELYRDQGHEIFTAVGPRRPSRSRILEFFSDLDSKVRELLRDLHFDPLDLLHPRYSNGGLHSVLSRYFGDTTLGDLRRAVLVTTLRLFAESGNWTPLVLHNLGEEEAATAEIRLQDRPTRATRLVDAALCTSAAPLYFPPYQHPDVGYCVDGGLFANCPASIALGLACRANRGHVRSIRILSIGTGVQVSGIDIPRSLPFERAAEYGALAWLSPLPRGPNLSNGDALTPAFPLISALLDASSSANSYICEQALGWNYHRVQMNLPRPIDLDDTSKGTLDLLQQVAMKIPPAQWQATTRWLRAQLA
ncbi:MAG: patatin-like phospholipase family protein [Isosphaeraceae bacterium]